MKSYKLIFVDKTHKWVIGKTAKDAVEQQFKFHPKCPPVHMVMYESGKIAPYTAWEMVNKK